MCSQQAKVLLIGSTGCGKTSMFNFLTGKPETSNPKQTTVCEVGQLKSDPDIVVVDTLGLEGDDSAWWNALQSHQEINFALVFINGTNQRPDNLSKLNYVYRSLSDLSRGSKTDIFKVLAIRGNNFEEQNFKYDYLEDHLGRFQFNTCFDNNSSCAGKITREKVYELVCSLKKHQQYPLFSPIKMIEALALKKEELRLSEKQVSQLKKKLRENEDEVLRLRIQVNQFQSALIDTERNFESFKINVERSDLQSKQSRAELVTYFVKKDKRGRPSTRSDSAGWHCLAWLPFAGSFILESKRNSQKDASSIVQRLEEINPTATIPLHQAS